MATEATKPTYQQTWIAAPRRPRTSGSANSESIGGPIAYSAPITTPSSTRTTNSCWTSATKACASPSTTKAMMSMRNIRRRPKRSVR
jgi:hypothetical protein